MLRELDLVLDYNVGELIEDNESDTRRPAIQSADERYTACIPFHI